MTDDLQDRLSDAWAHLRSLIQEAQETELGVQLIYGHGDPDRHVVTHEHLVGAELTFSKEWG